MPHVKTARPAAKPVVNVVEPCSVASSKRMALGAGAATGAAAGLAAAAATGVAAAGFATGRGVAAAAAAAPAAGRLGLTVIRAVSFGGAFLTTDVPDFLFVSAMGAGVAAAGLSGAPGTTGLTGATAPGVTGLIGLTGVTGRTGAAPPMAGAGATGATGLGLGVAVEESAEPAIDIDWVRLGGATGGGVGLAGFGGWGVLMTLVGVGIRGGGTTPSFFFSEVEGTTGGVETGGGGVTLSGFFSTAGGVAEDGLGGNAVVLLPPLMGGRAPVEAAGFGIRVTG